MRVVPDGVDGTVLTLLLLKLFTDVTMSWWLVFAPWLVPLGYTIIKWLVDKIP
jgi:hypothetical protein